jgi:hypothetical protein
VTRETSVLAYREIKAEGVLSELQVMVLNSLREDGPCTASELMEKAHARHPDWTISMLSNFEKRLSELRRHGVAEELPRRRCQVSGRMAIVWRASGRSFDVDDGQGELFGNISRPSMKGH